MRFSSCLRAVVFAFWLGSVSSTAGAALPISGDPVADGWNPGGNSLDLGTYIRGTGGFSFNVYSSAFTLAAQDGSWLAGDQVIGLGATTSGQYIYWPNLVAKFGSSTASFTASSLPSPNGDGNGSFSSGMAGLGGVQVDFEYRFDGIANTLQPGLAGTLLTPDNVLYNGPHRFADANLNAICDSGQAFASSACGIDPDHARVMALFTQNGGGQDILQSFEIVLNLSQLERAGYDPLPQVNGTSNLALQTFANAYTDALVTPVTEPKVYAMLLLGLGLVGVAVRYRRPAEI